MPTNPDIPTILIDGPFGKEMWAFYDESNYDNGFKHDPKAYQSKDGERCAQCEGDISLEYARSSRGYRYCRDCWEMSSFTKRGYHAETFNAKQIRREPQYQLAFDDWPLKIHVEHCPMNPFRSGGSTYTPKENIPNLK